MPAVEWDAVTGGSEPLVQRISRTAPVRPILRIVPATGPDSPPGNLAGALVVIAATHPVLKQPALLEAAAGLVVTGNPTKARQLASALPVPVLVPSQRAGPAAAHDAAHLSVLLLERAAAQAAAHADAVQELLDLAHGDHTGDRLGDLARWGTRHLDARLRVMPWNADMDTVAGPKPAGELEALAVGHIRGPVTVPGGLVLAAGRRIPRPLLVARRRTAFTARELSLLERAAACAAHFAWAEDVEAREDRLATAYADLRNIAWQRLMAGDLLRANRALESFLPGLVAAGAGSVAVLETAPGENVHALALDVNRAVRWQALTGPCLVDPRLYGVVHPAGREPLELLLRPVVEAVAGRSAGISAVTPWPDAARAFRTARDALSEAAGMPDRMSVRDGRVPLMERLSEDGRMWAAAVTWRLRELPRGDRDELLVIGQQALWRGERSASRFLGVDRGVVASRMATLSDLTGLDPSDPWQHAALYAAVQVAGLPLPVAVDPTITLEQVLNHHRARTWAGKVLRDLPPDVRRGLALWALHGSPEPVMQQLGVSRTTVYRYVKHAARTSHLDLTGPPGARALLLLALAAAGDLKQLKRDTLPPLSARHLTGGPRPGGKVTVPEIDTSTPHAARMYDYLLGGRTNFEPDRTAMDRILQRFPMIAVAAEQNRLWIGRVLKHILTTGGPAQILDLGSGIPGSTPAYPAVHEIARRHRPEDAIVVYVDNDPIVLRYAAAMLHDTPHVAVHGDVTAGAGLYDLPDIRRALDLSSPLIVCLNALGHFLVDDHEARRIISSLTGGLPSGSYVTFSQLSDDFDAPAVAEMIAEYTQAGIAGRARSRREIAELFQGLEVLPPGIVALPQWRPDTGGPAAPAADMVNFQCLVARVP